MLVTKKLTDNYINCTVFIYLLDNPYNIHYMEELGMPSKKILATLCSNERNASKFASVEKVPISCNMMILY